MEITLRQIADAFCDCRNDQPTDEERRRIYDRARMLRDKGHIVSTKSRSQGKTTTFTEADAAAAIVSLSASLDGLSWGIIAGVNQDVRSVGNTQGKALYEHFIDDIKTGVPVFIRLEVRAKPWGHTQAFMGYSEVLNRQEAEGTTLVLVWPVTTLVKPVFDALKSA